MKSRFLVPIMLVAGVVWPFAASADIILIDPATQNGSFELLGGTPSAGRKATHWDTDPDGDVDYWSVWGAAVGGPSTAENDSGTDIGGNPTDGTQVAFLQPGNAAYNLTSYLVQAGDVFTYLWDWTLSGRGNAIAQLAYSDGVNIVAIDGTDTTNPDTASAHLGLGTTYTALAGDPAIGNPIALTVRSTGNWPEVDNFVLSVAPIPEPSTLALFGSLALFLAIRRRRAVP